MPYEHIKISRDEPIRERHPRKGFSPNIRPADIPFFVTSMRASLAKAQQRALSEDIGGFDTRLLLKVNVREGLMAPDLEKINGITVVSQEEKSVVLAFATTAGLAEFESRLVSLTQSGKATHARPFFSPFKVLIGGHLRTGKVRRWWSTVFRIDPSSFWMLNSGRWKTRVNAHEFRMFLSAGHKRKGLSFPTSFLNRP
ncbi:hypothetical protein LP416_11430 [Polaromonas sp. P2-4]|nr:hypothetical protein LP416_11430 [Polaromonas sp. P2-4]